MEPVGAETNARWYGALAAVIDQRREVEEAYRLLVDRIREARAAGATLDQAAYAAGSTRTTVRRWLALGSPSRVYRLQHADAVVVGLVEDRRRAQVAAQLRGGRAAL